VAKEFKDQGVAGLDLAGPENEEVANRKYAPFFQQAREWGIPYTIHAGEAMGPESMREALALGTKRIGHGIRCQEDPSLVKELAEDGITLECCASSNLNTKVFGQIAEYPLRSMLGQNLRVTLNTDNMTVSATNLPREYQLMEEQGLTKSEEKQLYLNSVRAAFASQEEKDRLLALLEK
jgi:adenosine deaminase